MRDASLDWKGTRDLKEALGRSLDEGRVNAACWERLQEFARRSWWVMKVNENALNEV